MGIGSELKKLGRKAEREVKRIVKQVEGVKDVIPRDVRYALADAYFPGSATAIQTAQSLGHAKDDVKAQLKAKLPEIRDEAIKAISPAVPSSRNVFDYILGAPPKKDSDISTSVPQPRGVRKQMNKVTGQSAIIDQGVPWIIEQLEHPLFKEGRKAIEDLFEGRKISYVPGMDSDERQSNLLAGAASRYLPEWLGGPVSDSIREAGRQAKAKKKSGKRKDKSVKMGLRAKGEERADIPTSPKANTKISTGAKKRGVVR